MAAYLEYGKKLLQAPIPSITNSMINERNKVFWEASQDLTPRSHGRYVFNMPAPRDFDALRGLVSPVEKTAPRPVDVTPLPPEAWAPVRLTSKQILSMCTLGPPTASCKLEPPTASRSIPLRALQRQRQPIGLFVLY
jgi:hypothetical protein